MKVRGVHFRFVLVCLALFCFKSQGNTFNPDNRKAADTNSLPAKLVGKLLLPTGGYCTATLVGPDVILTAAHCVIDEDSHRLKQGKYQFLAGFDENGPLATADIDLTRDISKVHFGSTDPWGNYESDWALMRLDDPIGKYLGWLKVKQKAAAFLMNQQDVELIGYSSDKGGTTPVVGDCQIKGVNYYDLVVPIPTTYIDNCSMTPGSSGGPILFQEADKTWSIVAINISSKVDPAPKNETKLNIVYSDQYANYAVPVAILMPTLENFLANKP